MRSLAAPATAGLAALLALAAPDAQRDRRPPSGRAAPSRADAGSADGGRRDAGPRKVRKSRPRVLGDPPGTLRLDDAPAPTDGGLPDVPGRVGKLEQEVQQLRAREAALEAQLQQAQGQARLLEELNQQMAQLRAEVAAENQRRADAEQQRTAQREQVESAVSSLLSADQALAGGNADVDAALQDAAAALSGQSRRDLAMAQQALRNHDLAQARYYIGTAVAHARAGQ